MFLEVEDVADVSAAPLIDRLVFIADNTDILRLLRDQADECELERVCVLILVDEDVAKLVVVLFSDFVHVAEQSYRLDQQIVEVERVVCMQARLVHLVNLCHHRPALVLILSARGEGRRIFTAIFCGTDC